MSTALGLTWNRGQGPESHLIPEDDGENFFSLEGLESPVTSAAEGITREGE